MLRKYLYNAITFLLCTAGYAQLCNGSLGDPVVKLDFGSGTATHGAALGSSITSYSYSSADFPNDGSYTVESRTNTPATWWTTTDHTGGGYMMVVNASTSVTDYFYKNTVSGLCPNTTYEFAAWIMNLLRSQDNSTPNITFTIESTDGTVLQSYNTGDIPLESSAVWKHYGFYFQTPAGIDTVVIRMRNNKVGARPGNDIALDDITFSPCGPTVTSEFASTSGTSISVCEGQAASYTLTGQIVTSGVYTTPAYQWQISTDSGTTWTDISGATTTSVTVSPQTEGVYLYRLSTAESTNIASAACRVASNIITITINNAPDTPVATTTPTQCGVATGEIIISSPTGYTYSIDGVNYQSGTTFTGLAQATYSVTAKDATTGCVSPPTAITVVIGSGIPSAPAYVATAPATCATPNGSITITDSAALYSFDNGVTWGTANTAALPPGDYNVKVQNAAGCSSDATPVTITRATDYPPLPTATVTQTDCNRATGTIAINDTQAAYSFDNGITWQNSATKSGLVPNTYTILTKNTLGCLSDPLTVTISPYVNNEPLAVAASIQTFCIYNNATLADVAINGINIKWYSAATGGIALPLTTTLVNATTYYASQTVNTCESLRIPVAIIIQNTMAPTGAASQQFCTTQNPTVALLQAQGTNVFWYTSATGGTALAADTPLVNGATYYATQTINGCESQTRLAVNVIIVTPATVVANVTADVCDTDNNATETVDLTVYQNQILADATAVFEYYTTAQAANTQDTAQQLTAPSVFELTGVQTLYVRVTTADMCSQVAVLQLTLVSVPVVNIPNTVVLCKGATVTVNSGAGFDSYTWSTGETTQAVTFATAGNYSVTVTQNHNGVVCSTQKDFEVVWSDKAIITAIEASDWTQEDNTITVVALGIGDYEYSLDNVTWQDSNLFSGLTPGHYYVYVRDKNGCGTVSDDVFLLYYPKFFSPNGDGFNENWHVEYASSEPGIVTNIFDRYGKLIKQLHYQDNWDGTLNGRPLPSTDYWFVVTRANGKVYKGHFSLMR